MHFAYVDESGNTSTHTYTLACVLVDTSRWPATFDNLIGFRRFLRDRFGIPVRAEVKANYLLRNGGPFRSLKLGEGARHAVYRGFMRLQPKLALKTFAIVIRREELRVRDPKLDVRAVAWEYLLQRLERFTFKGNTEVLLIHDEGEEALVRKAARKARRAGTAGSAFGTGMLRVPAARLLDDPVPRRSKQSYFVQLADLNAYAAFRRVYPPPARAVQVVPETMWDELADARYADANKLKGGHAGIVCWPDAALRRIPPVKGG